MLTLYEIHAGIFLNLKKKITVPKVVPKVVP